MEPQSTPKPSPLIPIAIIVGFALIAIAIFFTGGKNSSLPEALKNATNTPTTTSTPRPIDATDYIRGNRLKIDGAKGVQLNFRPWDGQMRFPIVLATHNAVIAEAPLEGFLHQTNVLDTLGTDEPEHKCQ